MALYTTLQEPKDTSRVSTLSVPLNRECSATSPNDIVTTPDLSKKSASVKDAATVGWHGILYGFWPTLVYVATILAILVSLNVHWSRAGTMGFAQLDHLAAVNPSNLLPGPGWLLASRVIWFLATVIPLGLAVKGYRQRQQSKGEPLVLGGFEILLVFCTLWTWCSKAVYFAFASIVSSLYITFGCVPGAITTSSLWVLFDISFGMTWLVFWTCWIVLIPAAWLLGHKAMVTEMLSPAVLYLHNFNVVIMLLELLFSSWTVNLEHCIFPVYFGIAYVFFNWWLYSKIHKWIYFFLDYDRPSSVPVCLLLVAIIIASFWSGAHIAAALGKA